MLIKQHVWSTCHVLRLTKGSPRIVLWCLIKPYEESKIIIQVQDNHEGSQDRKPVHVHTTNT